MTILSHPKNEPRRWRGNVAVPLSPAGLRIRERQSFLSRDPGIPEALEDEIQAVLELIPVVVAGLKGVFGDEFDEVGVFVDGVWLEHALRHLRNVRC